MVAPLHVMMSKPTGRFCFVAVTLSALLAGCTIPPVRVDAPNLPAPLVESLPLHVAVYLPPAARTYAYKDKAGSGLTFQVGAASTDILYSAFRAGFTQVTQLEAPAVSPPAGVDAILTLEKIDWSVVSNPAAYTTLASYAFALSGPDGEPIGRWVTDQYVDVNETARDPGEASSWKLTELVEVPSELALEKVAAAFLLEFREQPQIRAWLEARQAYVPAMREAASGSTAGESAAGVRPPPGIHVSSDIPSRPVRRCVIKELRRQLPGRPVLTERSVRQGLFPWLSHPLPLAATSERLAALARYPPAVARFNELGVGTILLVAGGTTQDWHGGGMCGAGYGGGGCLGFMWGKRDSFIEAKLLDLSSPGELVSTEAHESGSAVLPMFILPLPFIPATQSAACHELGKALADRLQQPK